MYLPRVNLTNMLKPTLVYYDQDMNKYEHRFDPCQPHDVIAKLSSQEQGFLIQRAHMSPLTVDQVAMWFTLVGDVFFTSYQGELPPHYQEVAPFNVIAEKAHYVPSDEIEIII